MRTKMRQLISRTKAGDDAAELQEEEHVDMAAGELVSSQNADELQVWETERVVE